MSGIAQRLIDEVPIAVVDLETTGLYPGGDRIVELAVIRIEPKQQPELVLDTLINPRRPVSATEIHGITDEDVVDAPTFEEIAGNLLDAIAGCVFASYNVYFDSKFVQAELAQVGVRNFPPHLCFMYMRPMLGLGSKCSLADACQQHGVSNGAPHCASADALATARLWMFYRAAIESLGIHTFGDLALTKSYKFVSSFSQQLIENTPLSGLKSTTRLKSRSATVAHPIPAMPTDRRSLLAEYWDALTAAFADLEVTRNEIDYLLAKQTSLSLKPEELRWLHARIFSGILADSCQDKVVTSHEAILLHKVNDALRRLGWAPGDLVEDSIQDARNSVGLAAHA